MVPDRIFWALAGNASSGPRSGVQSSDHCGVRPNENRTDQTVPMTSPICRAFISACCMCSTSMRHSILQALIGLISSDLFPNYGGWQGGLCPVSLEELLSTESGWKSQTCLDWQRTVIWSFRTPYNWLRGNRKGNRRAVCMTSSSFSFYWK